MDGNYSLAELCTYLVPECKKFQYSTIGLSVRCSCGVNDVVEE